MPFKETTAPVAGQKAFQGLDDASVLSQAAQLLVLGAHLRGDIASSATAFTALKGSVPPLLPADDLSLLGVPVLAAAPGRIDSRQLQFNLGDQLKSLNVDFGPSVLETPLPPAAFSLAAERLYKEASAVAAAELMESCLRHPHELVRVAAASAYFERSSEPFLAEALIRRENLPMILSILADIGDRKFERELREFTEDRDPEVARAARNALRVLATHQ